VKAVAILVMLFAAAPALAQSPAGALTDSFKGNADKPLDIEAESLEVDDKSKLATFRGQVVARQGDFTLRAAEMIVTYTPQTTQTAEAGPATASAAGFGTGGAEVTRVEAKGGVDITSKNDQHSQSQWAIFEVKKQQVTIGGNVTVTQGKNVLKGERMVIDLTTGLTRMDAQTGAPGAKPGRMRAIFTPKPREGAGATAAPPAPATGAAPRQPPVPRTAPATPGTR
jgi:lipopolysaccharide export system protein LptA